VKKLRAITWPLRFGLVAAAAGTALVSVSGWRATHFEEIPRTSAPSTESRAAQLGSYRPALVSELDRAVDGDPFHPERRRPQIRYELPASRPEEMPEASPPPAEQIELIGTVVAAGGRSFAMCQTSAGPQIVHIGEKFVGHTLKSVTQGSAVFVSPQGKVMNVHVKKAGS
jgi:hypothetical protein